MKRINDIKSYAGEVVTVSIDGGIMTLGSDTVLIISDSIPIFQSTLALVLITKSLF